MGKKSVGSLLKNRVVEPFVDSSTLCLIFTFILVLPHWKTDFKQLQILHTKTRQSHSKDGDPMERRAFCESADLEPCMRRAGEERSRRDEKNTQQTSTGRRRDQAAVYDTDIGEEKKRVLNEDQ